MTRSPVEQAARKALALMQEVYDAHRDKGNPDYNGCDEGQCCWCDGVDEFRAALASLPAGEGEPQEVYGRVERIKNYAQACLRDPWLKEGDTKMCLRHIIAECLAIDSARASGAGERLSDIAEIEAKVRRLAGKMERLNQRTPPDGMPADTEFSGAYMAFVELERAVLSVSYERYW